MKPPKRRHRFTVDLHADDLEGVRHVLKEITFRVSQAIHGDHPITMITSGGYSNAWHVEHTVDESMTPESYKEALNAWLEQDRKTRREARDDVTPKESP